MLTPTAPTPKDHSTAPVIRDTLEMESHVLVSVPYFPGYHVQLRLGFVKIMS